MRRVVDRIAEVLIALLMAAITILVFVGVVFRYVLLEPISWIEEIARFFLVWVSFIGTYLAYSRGRHIAVTALVDRLPQLSQKIVRIVGGVGLVFFMAMLTVQGTLYSKAFLQSYSPILELPLGLVYAALPTAAFLLLIRILLDIGKEINWNTEDRERQ